MVATVSINATMYKKNANTAGVAPLPRWPHPCHKNAQLPEPISGSAFSAAPPSPK
ncbi:unannotated protein [freshwater metagenome]|uniref:Unannotated protein n=1 Tax=freshwater metagenome TaxID=449393 RepID=A0A6J6XEX9_9ZZZZ